ncbi:unnamed protein product [Sphagnum troendelagicum]
MKLFSKEEDEIDYTMTIKNVLRFELAINYVGIGMSFRQMAEAIQKAKDRTKTAKLAGLNDLIVGQYTCTWSSSCCKRSQPSSTMSPCGPCRWWAMAAHIAGSRSLTCACGSTITASWSTCISSRFRCLNAILQKTSST